MVDFAYKLLVDYLDQHKHVHHVQDLDYRRYENVICTQDHKMRNILTRLTMASNHHELYNLLLVLNYQHMFFHRFELMGCCIGENDTDTYRLGYCRFLVLNYTPTTLTTYSNLHQLKNLNILMIFKQN